MSLRVGGVFTGGGGGGALVMVRRKVSLVESAPSLTVTVMRALPARLARGVARIVRAPPLPPSARLPLGTRPVLPDVAVTMRLPGEVWASFTANGMSPVLLPAVMERSAMSLRVGGVLTGGGGGGLVAPP